MFLPEICFQNFEEVLGALLETRLSNFNITKVVKYLLITLAVSTTFYQQQISNWNIAQHCSIIIR